MIEITIGKQSEKVELIKPSKVYGQPYGQIYQEYFKGEPGKAYLISTGLNDRPVSIWWDDEEGRYRLSSESKKGLKEFNSWVKFRYLPNAIVTMEIDQ